MWRMLAGILAAAGLLTMVTPAASAADGHCSYRQFSPKLRSWYRVCQMPATPETCKDLVSAQKEQLEYGEGDCPAKGAINLCVIGGSKILFYQGKAEDVATGCEMMQGTSRPDLMPKT